jgi:hypothetical protein
VLPATEKIVRLPMICANNYRRIVQQPVVIAVSPKTEESFKLGNNGGFIESLITNKKLKSIDSLASTMEDKIT